MDPAVIVMIVTLAMPNGDSSRQRQADGERR